MSACQPDTGLAESAVKSSSRTWQAMQTGQFTHELCTQGEHFCQLRPGSNDLPPITSKVKRTSSITMQTMSDNSGDVPAAEHIQQVAQRHKLCNLLSKTTKTVSDARTAVICRRLRLSTLGMSSSLAPNLARSAPTTTLVPLLCMATISLQTAE